MVRNGINGPKAASGKCEMNCERGGGLINCAKEELTKKIHPIVFTAAVRELLILGRRKYRNIFIVGPTNCESR